MNILIVTQEDPFYIPIFFERFMDVYVEDFNIHIKGLIIQEPIGEKSILGLAKKMWNFYGPIDFLKQSYRYGLSKLNNILYFKGLRKSNFSVEYFVKSRGVSLLNYKDVNSKEFIDFVEKEEIDLIVSVSASQIFKKEILNTPQYGCINMHNAPLPYYRGMLPNFWQMYNDEKCSILTIHQMVETLDKGDIIYQNETKITEDMTLDDLIRKTKYNSADTLWEVLLKYEKGTIKMKSLPDVEGSYYTFPTKKDVYEFKKKGKRLL
ncbi:MAG: formyltransferase family protein [Anaeromicrobium sp.]|jgi:methionyl-tRNA formyltransferase|uniref:formyltransferase family protein n=1 Tax=Anaeromicrobium sp. TaxID=1929132 RepID=UPI0025F3A4DB|nr:formyltransferase family protein [Anaeromicrobium sp.]MCT4593973.1 formyltransferase family protein [Anaeromicrobium sp.]